MLSLEKFREIAEFGIADLALLIQESMPISTMKLVLFVTHGIILCSLLLI